MREDTATLLRLTTAWAARHRHPNAFAALGMAALLNGRADEAVAALEQALALGPHEAITPEWQYRLAMAHFMAGRDELACDWGQTAFDANPSLRWPAIHAAALLQLGQDDAARRAFEQHRALHAAFDGAQLARRLPGIHPALVAARERLLGCLQALAGQAALSASTFAPATSTGSRTARPIR